jgi:predicted membrane protein
MTVVTLVGAVACGARTTLDAPGGSGAACSPPTLSTTPCATWQPAGASQEISGDGSASLASLATSCGALVAWSTMTAAGASHEVGFETRVVAWDGSMAPPIAHGALSAQVPSVSNPGWWGLAEDDGAMGGLADVDQGGGFSGSSRFVRLDGSGAEQGVPVSLDPMSDLLGAASGGFSCLVQAPLDGPITLQEIHADGSISKTSLASGHTLASRLVYDDGSFLLHTFSGATVSQQHFVHHFDAHGVALAPEVELTSAEFGLFDVQLAATATGAMVAWASDGVHVAALDRDGHFTSSVQTLAAQGSSVTLAGANGDVAIAWEGEWGVNGFVQALAPDATPRGPAVELAIDGGHAVYRMDLVVEPNGRRAVFLYLTDTSRIDALPLRCAD